MARPVSALILSCSGIVYVSNTLATARQQLFARIFAASMAAASSAIW